MSRSDEPERNLFDIFHVPEYDVDDNQSDITLDDADADRSVDLDELDVDLSRRSSEDENQCGAGDGAMNLGLTARPSPITDDRDHGWDYDCSQIGNHVLPFTHSTGPTKVLDVDAKPIDFFHLLMPEIFFTEIANQTNLYSTQRTPPRPQPFEDTNIEEIKAFISIHIFMGICQLPRYDMYWSSDEVFKQAFVSNMMIRRRYEALVANFHLNDSTQNPPRNEAGHDPLHKVRPVISLVQETWPANYEPQRNVCVDEAMIAFKGRCAFRQYLPAKPTKWGLKVWAICDSESYYMMNMSIYTGKQNDLGEETASLGLGERVVRKLMEPYLSRHHVVYMDNYFTSLPLVHFLLQHETYSCGTMRTNRKGLPQAIKDPKCVKKSGDTVRICKDDVQAIAWYDRRKVTVVSSAHSSDDTVVSRRTGPNTTQEYSRPQAIADYGKFFSGVDKNDQLRSYYGISNKCFKWWKYIFWFCLDVSLINAYILYVNARGGPRMKTLTHLAFNISVMKSLAGTFSSRKTIGRPMKRPAAHELQKIATKRGRVCSHCKDLGITTGGGKPIQSTYMCLLCNEGLCKACFNPFHGFDD